MGVDVTQGVCGTPVQPQSPGQREAGQAGPWRGIRTTSSGLAPQAGACTSSRGPRASAVVSPRGKGWRVSHGVTPPGPTDA